MKRKPSAAATVTDRIETRRTSTLSAGWPSGCSRTSPRSSPAAAIPGGCSSWEIEQFRNENHQGRTRGREFVLGFVDPASATLGSFQLLQRAVLSLIAVELSLPIVLPRREPARRSKGEHGNEKGPGRSNLPGPLARSSLPKVGLVETHVVFGLDVRRPDGRCDRVVPGDQVGDSGAAATDNGRGPRSLAQPNGDAEAIARTGEAHDGYRTVASSGQQGDAVL